SPRDRPGPRSRRCPGAGRCRAGPRPRSAGRCCRTCAALPGAGPRATQAWRIASTGSRREARQAGTRAAPMPASVATAIAAGTRLGGRSMVNSFGPNVLNETARPQPASAPMAEPTRPSTAPWTRNTRSICRRRVPMARRMPISRVRWATLEVQAIERLRAAEADLERAVIRSTVAGTVLVRQVEPGDTVTPGQVLLEIAADAPG